MRQAFTKRLRAWAARRHGRDTLPLTISRRRVYILPTRVGLMLAFTLTAMLIAGLNYNSNLGLAFAFLMAGVSLVTMHHCNRNLLGLQVDVTAQADAFAGREASFQFMLRNDSRVDRRDIEIRCQDSGTIRCVGAGSSEPVTVVIPAPQRGVIRLAQFELRTLYPFGWFHAWTYVQSSLTAYVAPAPRGDRMQPATEGTGYSSRSELRGDEDFAGLRTYQPGMPLKHMAWKVLARGGDAAVRSYTSLAAQPEWLEWSSLEGLDDETRLSQLCLWVLESEAAQRVYGLRIPGREIPPSRGTAHRFACLRALAVHGFAEQP
jgi:uncharacterized protein (DUF58 family)